jgi:hypothetical protein
VPDLVESTDHPLFADVAEVEKCVSPTKPVPRTCLFYNFGLSLGFGGKVASNTPAKIQYSVMHNGWISEDAQKVGILSVLKAHARLDSLSM